MLVTLLGIVTLVRLVEKNAESPMPVTLSGIVTLVRLMSSMNALSPMAVTGRPVIVSGMTTTPPGPVYPVIVIAPLVTEDLN
jgi:hypothetical protein